MKRKRIFRLLTCLLAVVMCTTAFSMTAFADESVNNEEIAETDILTDESERIELALPEDILSLLEDADLEGLDMNALMDSVLSVFTQMGEGSEKDMGREDEASDPLTPDGNMTLVDDITGEGAEDKQFITVVTKSGNYFYIIIDRADDGENTVHFLNQVDEADLMALMEEGETEAPACTCTDKCSVGAINTACPVCLVQISECVGVELDPAESADPTDPEPPTDDGEKKGGNVGLIVLVLVILAGGGGAAFYFFVLKKKGKTTKVPSEIDDFDLEDEEYLIEEDTDTDTDTTDETEDIK